MLRAGSQVRGPIHQILRTCRATAFDLDVVHFRAVVTLFHFPGFGLRDLVKVPCNFHAHVAKEAIDEKPLHAVFRERRAAYDAKDVVEDRVQAREHAEVTAQLLKEACAFRHPCRGTVPAVLMVLLPVAAVEASKARAHARIHVVGGFPFLLRVVARAVLELAWLELTAVPDQPHGPEENVF